MWAGPSLRTDGPFCRTGLGRESASGRVEEREAGLTGGMRPDTSICSIWGGAGSWASRMGKVDLEAVIPGTGTPSVRGEGPGRNPRYLEKPAHSPTGIGGSGQASYRERGAELDSLVIAKEAGEIVTGLECMGGLEKRLLDLWYKKQPGAGRVGVARRMEAGNPKGCRGPSVLGGSAGEE